jgi:hypothetical protein
VISIGNVADVPPSQYLATRYVPSLVSLMQLRPAVIRARSSETFAGKGGTNTRSLTNPHKKMRVGTVPTVA